VVSALQALEGFEDARRREAHDAQRALLRVA
jgi:hypothetical protein